MGLSNIINDSLKFPFKNPKILLVDAMLSFINSLLIAYTMKTDDILQFFIFLILTLIATFVIKGFALKILKHHIVGESLTVTLKTLPAMILEDFVDGIKITIVRVFYNIVPAVIVIVVGFITGTFEKLFIFLGYLDDAINLTTNAVTISSIFNSIPSDVTSSLISSLFVLCALAALLYILFNLLTYAAYGVLAQTGSIREAIKIRDVHSRISSIGWMKYFGFWIFSSLTLIVLGVVGELLSKIPVVGVIIGATVFETFIVIFTYTAIGMVYTDNWKI